MSQPQSTSSSTSDPSFDRHSNPIIDVLAKQAHSNSSAQYAFLQPTNDGHYHPITYQQLYEIIQYKAQYYMTQLTPLSHDRIELHRERERERIGVGPCIGMLCTNNVDYITTLFALIYAGYVPVCLSPRNSKAGLLHLLKKSSCYSLIVDTEHQQQGQMVIQESQDITLFQQLIYQHGDHHHHPQYISSSSSSFSPFHSSAYADRYTAVTYLHSSGSTGFPKLLPLNTAYFMYHMAECTLFDKPITSSDILLNTLPLYHAMGLLTTLICLGQGICMAFPNLLHGPATPESLYQNTIQCHATALVTVPYILEQMIPVLEQQRDGYQTLASLRAVFYGGASCPYRIGDALQSHGINLCSVYGSTETGCVMRGCTDCQRPLAASTWHQMRIVDHVKYYWRPHEHGYELILSSVNPWISVTTGDYPTNDIFTRVSSSSSSDCEFFVYEGRLDSQIVHVTGEKTFPLPIEERITELCPYIKSVVVIGQQRFCNALLVELTEDAKTQDRSVVEMSIWDAVGSSNTTLPQHSRILRSMIYILPNDRSLPRTAKGNILRKLVEQEYHHELDQLYANLLTSSPSHGQASTPTHTSVAVESQKQWTAETLQSWLTDCLCTLFNIDNRYRDHINAHRSLFEQGLDSLLATQLHNRYLIPTFPMLQLSPNAIYQHSSIDALVNHLLSLLHHKTTTSLSDTIDWYAKSDQLVQKYTPSTIDLSCNPYTISSHHQVFLLTGVTGSLGNFVLSTLLHQSSVDKIYCLIRGSDTSQCFQRLQQSFQQRRLSVDVLSTHINTQRLCLLPCQLDDKSGQLGLDSDVYGQLCREVTQIIHVAWKMDFNSMITAFEPTCIQPTYHLLQLAHHYCRKRFHFISSVSAVMAAPETVSEQPITDQRYASPMGYGQSKLVAERIAMRFAQEYAIPVNIYRVGQLAGDTLHGVWNQSEHIPLLIKGAEVMGIMPEQYSIVDWVPVDIAAHVITEIALDGTVPSQQYHCGSVYTIISHLINPHAIPWCAWLGVLRSTDIGLQFKTVSPSDYLEALYQSNQDARSNPTLKLTAYYQQAFAGQMGGTEKLDIQHTLSQSSFLRQCPPIDQHFMTKVIAYWREIGFLKQHTITPQ